MSTSSNIPTIPLAVLKQLVTERTRDITAEKRREIEATLKAFGITDLTKGISTLTIAISKLDAKNPNCDVMLLNNELKIAANPSSMSQSIDDYLGVNMNEWLGKGEDDVVKSTSSDGSSSQGPHRTFEVGRTLTDSEVDKFITSSSYVVTDADIRAHLERFLYEIKWEDDAYRTGDIKVYIYNGKKDVDSLIAAGTKVLDALIYAALNDKPEAQDLFVVQKVEKLTANVISGHMTDAKRALLAGLVLVFIQGSLPSKADSKKPVPKFIKEKIFKSNIANLSGVAEILSSTDTEKFPAKLFLDIDLDKVPKPICTRCKLSIAGNRAVRYAVFSAGFARSKEVEPRREWDGMTYSVMLESNKQVNLANKIFDILRMIAGNYKTQLRMHPLAPNRPVIKDFTLKLTKAILVSIDEDERHKILEKAVADENLSFQRDTNFVGVVKDGIHTFPIMTNPDADFSSLTPDTIREIYGLN
nr:TPA_asm: coat protein [Boraginaceae associated ophiovirus]